MVGESRDRTARDADGKRGQVASPEGDLSPPLDPAAPTHILKTKLRPPQVAPGLVDRSRLLAPLTGHTRFPVTLVSAPAGYGKTTLISQWLQRDDDPPAWLQLGEGDDDLRTFLSYLVAAIQARFPGACPEASSMLGTARLPPATVLADALNNDLESVGRPFTLVIDDYHHVHDNDVHDLLDQVLKFPPRPLQLVLITRHDPPLSLAFLRARGWMAEIRQEDLRFSREEARAVLQHLAGADVSDEALDRLDQQMEGWAVGLHLVGLLLQNQAEPEAILRGLRGGFSQVHDYLIEEVLARQPASMRECLLEMSVLDRFSAPLIEDLCRPHGGPALTPGFGQELLESSRRANLFVIALDAQGEWNRFHHLFRDLLQRQLERSRSTSEIADLHRRAGGWFESQGLISAAIGHALACGNEIRAAEMVENHAYHEFLADRWYVVEHWTARLPVDVRNERPKLLLIEARIANCRFEMARAPQIVERVETLLLSNRAEPTQLGDLAYLKGWIAFWAGDAAAAKEHLTSAVAQLVDRAPCFESEAQLILGLARCMLGERTLAMQALEDRINAVDTPEGHVLSRLVAARVFIHLISGDLVRARAEAERLHGVATEAGIHNTEAWSYQMAGQALLNSGRLEEASQQFTRAIERRYVLEPIASLDAMAGQALAQQLLRLHGDASETLDRLESFARDLRDPRHLTVAHACRARVSVLRGDPAAAMEWARSYDDAPEPSTLFTWLECPAITQARVLIASGSRANASRAVDSLRVLRELTEGWRFDNQTIEIAAMQSLALAGLGRVEEALAALRDAVALAEPGGWVRPFIEAGRPMADLLELLHREAGPLDVVDRLRDAFPKTYPAAPGTGADPANAGARSAPPARGVDGALVRPLIEALTNREFDVLHRLADRLYDKEIAEALSISVWTVRTHVKHIFEKLHVTNRRQAVLKAEELGLLRRGD